MSKYSSKMAIYTAITGGYDEAINLRHIQKEIFDYILFTDALDFIAPEPWTVVYLENENKFSSQELNRHVKMHPFEYLDNYESSLYIDGNVDILSSLQHFYRAPKESEFIIYKHPVRNDIISECAANLWMGRFKLSDLSNLTSQLKYYKNKGFDLQGLYEANIIYRKHTPFVRRLMADWWEQFYKGVRRDQISLPFVLWKNRKPNKITILSGINSRAPGGEFFCHGHNTSSLSSKLIRKIGSYLFPYWLCLIIIRWKVKGPSREYF